VVGRPSCNFHCTSPNRSRRSSSAGVEGNKRSKEAAEGTAEVCR
jgi:hypothetical protein